MDQNLHRKGLVNWLLLLALGALGAIVARHANSASGIVASVFLGTGFLVALVSYFQMRVEERERLEQLELDELQKAEVGGKLFGGQTADTLPARRSREQFERYFVPVFSFLLFLFQAGGAYALWKGLAEDKPATLQQATLAMALNGLFTLLFFQFGKYSAVLATLERQRLLRPQSSYLLLGAVLSVVVALVEVAGWAGYPRIDWIVARVLTAILALVAVENLLTLVFELYRPRLKGQAEHPLYESRLIGLLSQPGGIITTAAQALDYQFGFKVSETWFYRFLEKAFAWLVLLQLGVLLLSTTVVFIEPGQQAILERFGRPVQGREVLGPGPQFKLPWPIDKVYTYDTDRVQTFTIGHAKDAEHEEEHRSPLDTRHEEPRVITWTKAHVKDEYNMLVASREKSATSTSGGEQAVPVSLLAVGIPVQYQISDLKSFACLHAEGGQLLERLAAAEVCRYFVSVDINDVVARGRLQAAEDLRNLIQKRADAQQLGVRILFVGLYEIHPPVKVAPDYESTIGAIQDKEATNLYAKAYLAERVPIAKAEAALKLNQAETVRLQQAAAAIATAGRFTNQLAAWQASPQVYSLRTYLETVGRSIASARKYVVTLTNSHSVVTLNLEDKLRQDLLDVTLPAAKK